MAQRHTISARDILRLVQQVGAPIDVSKDYRVVINVKGGEAHLAASNNLVSKDPACIECDRYEDLLERREAARYPNVEGVK